MVQRELPERTVVTRLRIEDPHIDSSGSKYEPREGIHSQKDVLGIR